MGVTFKIITLSAAIEEGLVNIFEDRYTDSGAITVDGATLHCWKHGGHGDQSYLEVVENSCNLVEQQEILSIMKILLNFQGKNVVDIKRNQLF